MYLQRRLLSRYNEQMRVSGWSECEMAPNGKMPSGVLLCASVCRRVMLTMPCALRKGNPVKFFL